MKKYLFMLMIILSSCAEEDKSVEVEFIVRTDSLADSEKVFIVGNHKKLGMWDPGLIELEKESENIFRRKISFYKDDTLEFKFTKGLWQNEALDSSGKVPPNYIIIVERDTAFQIEIEKWKNEEVGQITGRVEYLRNLTYKDLLPRDAIVWLPPNYYELEDQYFPVLYMHDGQNIFDPKTSFAGTDWQLDETADSLIKHYVIEPIIIVGIYNTENRRAEYTPTDTGEVYLEFIVKKLKPLIDTKYRTKPDRDNTATGGSSAGGLISFMLAWEYDDVFKNAACLSPAFKIEDIDYVNSVINSDQRKSPLNIYIDNGGTGLEKRLQPGVDEMTSALKNRGFREGENLFLYFDKNAEHNESAWAERIHRPLEIFFGR